MDEITRDENDVAEEVLKTLLSAMGVEASVVCRPSPPADGGEETEPPVIFDISGDDLGILIGWRGQTLASLQYITRLIVTHRTKRWVPIVIDIEGYKQRRYDSLRALALRIAEQVKAKGTQFTLEPMPAYERRIVHLTLANHPDITTQSIGEGVTRKVVILPRKEW
ncbi:MAG: R3H domain-containing nucleic acid-binding protein [Chloroflexota bacterium]|nr:R3H domain-containing nucleic acid-binding protein [Chloroflexota bacterium]